MNASVFFHLAVAADKAVPSQAIARSMIETVNGYSYTPLAAVEAARRVLEGQRLSGFATPVRVFGGGFAESIEGTLITDF